MSKEWQFKKESHWNKIWAQIDLEKLVDEYRLNSYYVNKMKVRAILSATTVQKASPILEPGCGTAKVSLKLGEYGYEVIALDSSPNAIRKAYELSKRLKLPKNVEFVIGDIRFLPFRSNSFALVFNSGVLEHFSAKDQVDILREMSRVVQLNKALILVTPNILCLRRSVRKVLLDFLQKLGLSAGWPWGEEKMLFPWTLKKTMQELGLRNIKTWGICFSPLPFLHPDSSLTSNSLFKINLRLRSRWLWKICEIIDTKGRILPLLFGKDTVTKATKSFGAV